MRNLKPVLHNRAFRVTRWRLTALYVSTMGVILAASAIGFYVALAQDHRREIDHRLETVASTLHDSLEPSLEQPGQLTPVVWQLLPSLCSATADCPQPIPDRHVLSLMHQEGYYLRFLNLSGEVLAIAGQLPEQSIQPPEAGLYTLQASDGRSYRQMSLLLKNNAGNPWGYLEVGSSLHLLDRHLAWVKLALLGGLPVAFGLVWGASWWVAGVAIRPAYGAYLQIQQFTADAAHELRTPLAAVRASAESVSRAPYISDAEARDILQVITRQSQRLGTLVNDLLILSRLDQPSAKAQETCCCLQDLVADIEEELSALAVTKDIQLTAVYDKQPALCVRGNEEQLYRTVLNVVVNALEYTSQGGKVTIHLSGRDRQAWIAIEDTGIGISPADQAQIFDRFYRVHPDRSRHTGGSGLGLAIAQAIARAHGGNIHVKSELGKGSCFTIQLPTR
ncbi:two-component system sensor histidine kinase RppB [Pseudanabaena sp. FACHB-2040]|uniref:two-component system sensor histidine kinase RppB n=1 Tax=Pseudanabaena sp. FACHB-2040 TaxID=2692859 RepID=UPI001684BCCC|nr:two-component system sensor histidine kinase RppB [Pseudanabaena sp. FACHB-2040]MBD2259394.1 two-component sensor histidine kinase [Pseudanabaena sp. FACHB-2040]